MMAIFGGIILVVGFLLFLKMFKLVERSKNVIVLAKFSVDIIRDSNMDDYQKETVMQKNALQLLSLFFQITFYSVIAVAIPFGVVWFMEYMGLLSLDEVIDVSLSIEFILAVIILSVVFFYAVRKR